MREPTRQALSSGAEKAELPEAVNINISAYRVLYILLLLVRYRALNAVELNRFLYENPHIQRIYNTETLTKYVNTLREVGCEIPRSTVSNEYAYELRKNPFPLKPDADEMTAFSELMTHLQRDPGITDEDLTGLQEKLDWLLEASPTGGVQQAESANSASAVANRSQKLVRQYRRYCREMFTLDIRYPNAVLSEGERRLIEPHEVLERLGRVLLLGSDRQTQDLCLLDTEKILSVAQLPIKNRRSGVKATVTFALTGKLAAGYRLYPEEKIVYRAGDVLHVKARAFDTHALLNRLMKYGPACRVLSPEPLRQEMHARILQRLQVLKSGD